MKIKSVYIILIILILNSANLMADGTIKGRITDIDTRHALIGANVLVKGTVFGSATDYEGRYVVENIPAGEVTLKVTYIGYEEKILTVDLTEGQTLVKNIQLLSEAIEFDTYVVTASRRRERLSDAPAAISVISERAIRRESNTNLGDYLKSIKGVDFTQSGVDSYNLSARGFNSSMSSRFLALTDGRLANVPSLRLIGYNVIPISADDVQQIEVVLGPSSAMYGPNAHSGVLNIITKPPRYSKPLILNLQAGEQDIRKISGRGAITKGPFGAKLSAVYLTAYDWEHYNEDELESHTFTATGDGALMYDGIDALWQNKINVTEDNSPMRAVKIQNPWPNGGYELTEEYLNENLPDGVEFYQENGTFYAYLAYTDGIDNDGDSEDFLDVNGNGVPDIGEPGVNSNGWVYADGIDNNFDGQIDEYIDEGIDDFIEKWFDGIDNDGNGLVDDAAEIGEFFHYGPYIITDDGQILYDTNGDGKYGTEDDSTLYSYRVHDANYDGLKDFVDFDVKNIRYDFRMDYDPSEDFKMTFASGYAWARNLNITPIARYLADGWKYRYYHGRLTWKNLFMQAYLNTSNSGKTRSMSTGGIIIDKSKKFSFQMQHHTQFFNERVRFVWGLDYFRTMPQTFDTILNDNNLWDHKDNNGNGEDGSPTNWDDTRNDNQLFDFGVDPFLENFYDTVDSVDNVSGALEDGIDNDKDSDDWLDMNGDLIPGYYISNGDTLLEPGVTRLHPGHPSYSYSWDVDGDGTPDGYIIYADGIDNDGDGKVDENIDEGIDEKDEDNRRIVNELGLYFQLNTKLTEKLELVSAVRFDAHEYLTDFIDFNREEGSSNPFKWTFDFSKTAGLQVSPKIGLVYKPKEQQNFRVTWARAFNTPSNQNLFLDIFVQRFAVFRVYARGSGDGYIYPRDENGNIIFYNIRQWESESFGMENLTDCGYDFNGDRICSNQEGWMDEYGNGSWDFLDDSTYVVTDGFGNPLFEYDFSEIGTDGVFDYFDYGSDGIPGEPFFDCGYDPDGNYLCSNSESWQDEYGNGYFDGLGSGEWWLDYGIDGIPNTGDYGENDLYPTGLETNTTEGNGYYDVGEPADWNEPWSDKNGNGLWDEKYKLFYPSVDPNSNGTFTNGIKENPKPLKAEVIQTLEFGYKGRLAKPLYATLDIFYSKYSDFVSGIQFITPLVVNNDSTLTTDDINANTVQGIVVVGDTTDLHNGINPPVVVGYLNYGKVSTWGFDASFTFFASRKFIIEGNFSHMGVSNLYNPLTDSFDSINSPKNKWALKTSYEMNNGLTISGNFRHVDSFTWESGLYYGVIGGYDLLDVHLGYSFNEHLKLYCTLNNIFNNKHVEIIGGPALGRQVVVRLSASL